MILLVKTLQRALITGILGPEGIPLPEYLFGPCGEGCRIFRCTRSFHAEQIDGHYLNQERHRTSDQLIPSDQLFHGCLKNPRSLQPLDIALHRPIRIDILNYSAKACSMATPRFRKGVQGTDRSQKRFSDNTAYPSFHSPKGGPD